MAPKAKRFVFERFERDLAERAVNFWYTSERENGEIVTSQERIVFPDTTAAQWDAIPEALLERLLQSLHLILGISYWKMYCAPRIEIHGYALDAQQADFWNTVYTKGLGEFFYNNKIDYRGLVQFPFIEMKAAGSVPFPRSDRSLLPIGGGKDSIVSLEWLKEHGKAFSLFSLKSAAVQSDLAKQAGTEYLVVDRILDQDMLARTKSGEAYNGHLPITAVYTFVGLLAAALHDDRYIVFSNERSANIGNVEYLGQEINHQWSKSLEAEQLIAKYVRDYLTPDIKPFSLLRPLYEIEIIRRFAQYPQYFNSFSSCNRNFAVTAPVSKRSDHAYWCGFCPKCAFVFACLAAFLPKATVVDIFGKNLFADANLIPLYKAMLGLESFKPFECVGTPDEMKVAMHRANQTGEYTDDAVMKMFVQDVLQTLGDIEALEKDVFDSSELNTMPV